MATPEQQQQFEQTLIDNEISVAIYEPKPNGLPPRHKFNVELGVYEDPLAQTYWIIFKAGLAAK